jgi:hypothetical protein
MATRIKRKLTDKVTATIGNRTFRPEVRTVIAKNNQKKEGLAGAKCLSCKTSPDIPDPRTRAMKTLARVGIAGILSDASV